MAQESRPPARTPLTPDREARRDLAVQAVLDAHGSDAFEPAVWEMLRVDRVVKAEQAAERGGFPDTYEGCVGVLRVAERIVRAFTAPE